MMFKNDWVRYGFGDDLLPISTFMPFIIDYSAATPHPKFTSPVEISREVAWEIYERLPKPVTLMISGGVDSQAMSYSFKTAGVPVRYVMALYNDGLNDYDRSDDFYSRNGIDVEFIDFDILGFHQDELKTWATKYQNNSPHFLTHCAIAAQIGGSVVSSGCIVADGGSVGNMTYAAFGFTRYAEKSNQPVVGYFFSYDPHLVHCTYRMMAGTTDAYEGKCSIYQRAGFPIIPQTKKYSGFEKLKEKFDSVEVSTRVRMKYKDKLSSRPYDLLFRYPLHDLLPCSEASKTIVPSR